jgi:two-component system, OmpR family, phosphate regulon response regulator PhoB
VSHDSNTRESELAAGPIAVDHSCRQVSVSGEDVHLTALEHRLLLALMERRGRAQSRQQLYVDVWKASPDVRTRTVDMHVQRLRRKMGEAAELIETVRGVGYRFK